MDERCIALQQRSRKADIKKSLCPSADRLTPKGSGVSLRGPSAEARVISVDPTTPPLIFGGPYSNLEATEALRRAGQANGYAPTLITGLWPPDICKAARTVRGSLGNARPEEATSSWSAWLCLLPSQAAYESAGPAPPKT